MYTLQFWQLSTNFNLFLQPVSISPKRHFSLQKNFVVEKARLNFTRERSFGTSAHCISTLSRSQPPFQAVYNL